MLMQEKQLSRNNNGVNRKNMDRVYILLDKPFNMCIIDYKWSSTDPEWILEKMVWNTWDETLLQSHLRDGKYYLALI